MPEIVVSNTTPLLNLLKINHLHLLKDLYKKVYIPESVYYEIEAGKKKEYYSNLKDYDFIEILPVMNPSANIFNDLDQGEADALLLALEKKADLIIIDEKLARRYAQNLNLNLTGTIGILIKAYRNHLIENVESLLAELQSKGTYISDKMIKEIENKL